MKRMSFPLAALASSASPVASPGPGSDSQPPAPWAWYPEEVGLHDCFFILSVMVGLLGGRAILPAAAFLGGLQDGQLPYRGH
jgi:hypothetical protein